MQPASFQPSTLPQITRTTSPSPRIARGYSLIEALVVLSIMTVLSAYAIFAAPAWISVKKADSQLNDMRTLINLARHAAIVRGENVIVCPRGNDGCGARNAWHNGAWVFADRDHNRRYSPADTWLAASPGIQSGRIYWRAFRSRSYLMFTPRGITDWQNGHLLYCPVDGDIRFARQLVLNVAGRTYTSVDRDGDGVHEDVRGRPLRCV